MLDRESFYLTGEEIRVGDHVACADWRGIVRFVLATDSFAPGFAAEDWAYLGHGFMVEYDNAGLVFAETADHDLVFVRRAEPE
jgi:hypothetical protein